MPRYIKVGPKHPSYLRVQANKQAGIWICDAVTHNSNKGCSNPNCFNYKIIPTNSNLKRGERT